MAKYKKKPVIIDAWQWNGGNHEDAKEFVKKNNLPITPSFCSWPSSKRGFCISTLEGDVIARKGDWIIKGVEGKFYPCKPRIFKQTYEKVKE